MLNWICPDCGRECEPSSRECPGCAEPARISPASASTQSAVSSANSQPSVIVLAPAVHTPNGNGHGSYEPPQPTQESLQALVENLEQQIRPEPDLAPALESAGHPPLAPLVTRLLPAPVAPPPPAPDESTCRAFLEAQRVHAEELLDLQAHDAARQGARLQITSCFQLTSSTLLLNAAQDVIQAPAPMQQNYLPLPRPIITIRPLVDAGPAPAAGPQPLLLAGPILPAELRNLGGRTAPGVKQTHKPKVPAWMISVTVVTVMVLGVASVMQNRSSDHGSASAASTAQAATQPSPEPAAAPVEQQHPLARFIEVTGLRVVADLQHRSQLQYIVVNHSASEATGLVLQIAVRSFVQDSKEPLFHVSAVVPSLGPYQAKEIRTDLDTPLQSTPIPDWGDLKADVQVTTR